MSASLHVPLVISAKKKEDLTKKLLMIQANENGRVHIISIYYDSQAKEHVLWYYPIRNLGGSLF